MEERSSAFLEDLVRLLVAKPEEVSVERRVDDMGVLLTLRVDPSDMGRVLGKKGVTAGAIRTLLRAIGAADRESVHLKIHDPERDGSADRQ